MEVIHASSVTNMADEERRARIFDGDLIASGQRDTGRALCQLTRNVLEQKLGSEPPLAQQRMSEIEFAGLFTSAHAMLTKRGVGLELVRRLVADLGCDPHSTYVGPPRLVAMTGDGFLAYGFGFPRHPHRDMWYADSPSEVEWWISVYDLTETASLAFHPRYWERPLLNSSQDFDFERWYRARRTAEMPTSGSPEDARALEPVELAPEVRVASRVGGVFMFSPAQLYSIVPNPSMRTGFAVHFRTANVSDLLRGVGAPNLDARPRGSALTALSRCDDLSPFPKELLPIGVSDHTSAFGHAH
jgi:hypothetical protein